MNNQDMYDALEDQIERMNDKWEKGFMEGLEMKTDLENLTDKQETVLSYMYEKYCEG